MPIAGGSGIAWRGGVTLEAEACEVVCPIIALPLPAGWVSGSWFNSVCLGLEYLPGPVIQGSCKAMPQVLVAAGVGGHLFDLSLASRADCLTVRLKAEEAGRGFSSFDDREEFAFVGGAIEAPVRGYQSTEDKGGYAVSRDLDHGPTSRAIPKD
eukprot:4387683-Amphidinium_carterae.1